MASEPRLLTTGDVARLCGFSPSAVLQWIRSGKLPAYSSPGGQHRVDPGKLLTFLKEHRMRVPPELAPQDTYRILIVDDDETVRDLLARWLRESNIRCVTETAKNGVLGCMKIPIFKPHLIVLDVVMPELDGVEMCRSVKSSDAFKDTKVFLITGYPEDERLQKAMLAGADGWMTKPVTVKPFIQKVAAMLGLNGPTESTTTDALPTSQ